MRRMLLIGVILGMAQANTARAVDDKSPLVEKAAHLQQVLLDRHWLDGLYVGIIDSPPPGAKLPLPHTVNQPGNVIHAGVWTGRYLGGVGYQYAVTKDPRAREIGGQILKALRILQEVTGKPGLLCRGATSRGTARSSTGSGTGPTRGSGTRARATTPTTASTAT